VARQHKKVSANKRHRTADRPRQILRRERQQRKEALAQHAATAEILRSISAARADATPVFEAIARNAHRLCRAAFCNVLRYDGERIHVAATHGFSPQETAKVRAKYPVTTDDRSVLSARVILSCKPEFITDVYTDSQYDRSHVIARALFGVPMLHSGVPVGAIVMGLTRPGRVPKHQQDLLQTFADQAVIAIENARLFNETREALERQTATSEILKVISKSPSDIQPVFDAVAESAARLCDATDVIIRRIEDGVMRAVAHIGSIPLPAEVAAIPVSPKNVAGRAVIERRTIHIHDVTEGSMREEYPEAAFLAQRGTGFRTLLVVPLVRNDVAVGLIGVRREEKHPFSDQQIGLLQTFADQAVIAIENVRLFNETKEALEQQTATAEILRVMSSSPGDVQPVFDAVARKTSELCNRNYAVVVRYDGELIHLAAEHNARQGSSSPAAQLYPRRPGRDTPSARAVLERAIVHIPYADKDPDLPQELVRRIGAGSFLAVPLLREGRPIGVIGASRVESGPFPAKQIELVKVFADQAVIAIENVRLFNETKEALERQTATAEILKVIASSPSDVQPVFEAVAQRAAQLCNAAQTSVHIAEGADLRRVSTFGHSMPLTGRPPRRTWINGRAFLERRTIHVEDVATMLDEYPEAREPQQKLGLRTMIAVPMIRKEKAVGTISVWRREVKPFSKAEIELLETFAAQAVIAIENVRLFNETKEALERQTATSEILGVISGSPTDLQPVFKAILASATRLCDAHLALLNLYDGDAFRTVAHQGGTPEFLKWLYERGPFKAHPLSRLAGLPRAQEAYGTADLKGTTAYQAGDVNTVNFVKLGGGRSYAVVPLVKDAKLLGAIAVYRSEVKPFTEKHVQLVKTFANQAVIAIENVRLFKELQERTEALTKSVDQLTALGEVGQAISSTLDLETVLKTIVSRAVQLTGLDAGGIYEYDAATEQFHLRAAVNMPEVMAEVVRRTPIRKGEGAVGGTAVALEAIQVPDTQDESYKGRLRALVLRTGRRALLAVPLLHEGHILGALSVHRNTPGPFAPEVVELLKTFATQSAMAIQNARLFREIAEKGRQLEVASQHKSQFLASMSHELRTPLNAILGFNEMLLDHVYGELSEEVKAPLENMQASGKHLLRLINNVLDLAKIEAGRMELALSDYSVQDTVESVRSTLRPLAESKGLELLATVPQDLPLAYGDPGRITQCLMNLAGNSLKFTKEGRVEISVQQQNGQLRYRVADTGIGIPPDKIGSLFTEFKQTDATIASEYGGTGLGLSITKKFIEMHGGRIWVESEPGTGSTFTFEVPLRAGEGKAA
jgi:GAF domain-containing protein